MELGGSGGMWVGEGGLAQVTSWGLKPPSSKCAPATQRKRAGGVALVPASWHSPLTFVPSAAGGRRRDPHSASSQSAHYQRSPGCKGESFGRLWGLLCFD